MPQSSLALGALLGGVTSLPVLAFFYLGNRLAGLPFVPFDLFDWLARVLPGGIVTLGIDAMITLIRRLGLGATDETAKQLEGLLALGLVVIGGVLLGVVIAWAMHGRPQRGRQIGALAGLVVFLVVAAIEISFAQTSNSALGLAWLAFVYVSWGALLGLLLVRTAPSVAPTHRQTGRRAFLTQIAAGSVGVAVAAWGVGRLWERQQDATGAGQPLVAETTLTPTPGVTPLPEAVLTPREVIEPAPGTRPEITPNAEFYRIDINLRPPVIEGDAWVLETAGLFDNARSFTLAELMAFPTVTVPLTLACISNPIGGDLIGASNWTGLRLRDLLAELGLQPAARELYLEATDGFYESVTMADMLDQRTLLVYGMNGETLPIEHGFPLRIYIPNRYGMKQPKWITRMEAIGAEGSGYWVERGWSEEARPNIISIIDTVAQTAPTAEGAIPIGGIAWAGTRGIQTVQVQVDDGEWREALLRTPPLSGLIWVQWRYDWPAQAGQHTFQVRAIDDTGAIQVGERTDAHPSGATGYHTVTVTI